ncbi:MAG: hypothetical protein ACJ8C4_21410 [Gemmataceae bacterium]
MSHARPRFRWLRLAIAVVLIITFTGIAWGLRCVYIAVEAERNLQAITRVISLVDRFVNEQGRWPQSWSELEKLPQQDPNLSDDWPTLWEFYRQRLQIDFQPDLNKIAHQDPMQFTAIKPVGLSFEYRDYGTVAALQATIRKHLDQARN